MVHGRSLAALPPILGITPGIRIMVALSFITWLLGACLVSS